MLLDSTGVGTHYIICGVCLGYTEKRRDGEGCDYSDTHTYDDIIHWLLLWHTCVHPSSEYSRHCTVILGAAEHPLPLHSINVQSGTKLLPFVLEDSSCTLMSCTGHRRHREFFFHLVSMLMGSRNMQGLFSNHTFPDAWFTQIKCQWDFLPLHSHKLLFPAPRRNWLL